MYRLTLTLRNDVKKKAVRINNLFSRYKTLTNYVENSKKIRRPQDKGRKKGKEYEEVRVGGVKLTTDSIPHRILILQRLRYVNIINSTRQKGLERAFYESV